MTNEEAISYILANYFDGDEDVRAVVGGDEEHLAMKCAVEALEKQIPKKPKVSFQSEFYWCPDCECAIKMRIEKKTKNIRYCPFCGQALDWSERNGGDENGL